MLNESDTLHLACPEVAEILAAIGERVSSVCAHLLSCCDESLSSRKMFPICVRDKDNEKEPRLPLRGLYSPRSSLYIYRLLEFISCSGALFY